MRYVYLVLLILFIAVVGAFAVQNNAPANIGFLNIFSFSAPLSLIIAGSYVLGMFSGWWVIGFIKSTYRRATERKKR